jgi:hypothetical protein
MSQYSALWETVRRVRESLKQYNVDTSSLTEAKKDLQRIQNSSHFGKTSNNAWKPSLIDDPY